MLKLKTIATEIIFNSTKILNSHNFALTKTYHYQKYHYKDQQIPLLIVKLTVREVDFEYYMTFLKNANIL